MRSPTVDMYRPVIGFKTHHFGPTTHLWYGEHIIDANGREQPGLVLALSVSLPAHWRYTRPYAPGKSSVHTLQVLKDAWRLSYRCLLLLRRRCFPAAHGRILSPAPLFHYTFSVRYFGVAVQQQRSCTQSWLVIPCNLTWHGGDSGIRDKRADQVMRASFHRVNW